MQRGGGDLAGRTVDLPFHSVDKKLTKILQAVAGLVESPGIELQSDDGEDEDSEEEKKGDVDKGSNSFSNGAHNHL